MKRQLIAIATAAALALSGFAAPAEARSKKNDMIKLLLGAAAVGLILNQMNQGKAEAVTPRPNPNDWNNRYLAVGRSVPAECVMDVTVNGRLREVVSSRCLREFGVASQLPADCAFDIRTNAGTRTVYGPQCLRDFGYRIEQARY